MTGRVPPTVAVAFAATRREPMPMTLSSGVLTSFSIVTLTWPVAGLVAVTTPPSKDLAAIVVADACSEAHSPVVGF